MRTTSRFELVPASLSPLIFFLVLLLGCTPSQHSHGGKLPAGQSPKTSPKSIYTLDLQTIEGQRIPFKNFQGKILVIANISIGCATAPQLADLEQLYQRYKERGLVVVGYPSDDFAPPGYSTPPNKTQAVCRKRYGVTFPLSTPGHIKGAELQPVYNFLSSTGPTETTGPVSFNLEKFIVDRSGNVRARFGPFTNVTGTEFLETIEALLSE